MPPKSSAAAGIPADLKLNNRIQVLNVFKCGREYTANEVAAQIGLSRQTAMKAIQFFVDKGLLTPAGKGASTNVGGKKPALFSLASDKYLLCIEIWPEELNFILLDFRGAVIDRFTLKQPLLEDAARTMETVGGMAVQLLAQNRVDKAALYGVSVSTPGIIDYKAGVLKYNSLCPTWGADIPVVEMLRPYFGGNTRIVMENVAKMTARSLLQNRDISKLRVLAIFSAWGLSGCLIDRGYIQNGKDSLIGEFGHMILDASDPERCGCGGHGCFERLVSNTRVRADVEKRLEQYPDSMFHCISREEMKVETLFELSGRGDALARAVVKDLAGVFAMALRNITLLYDPDLVVFQGDYAHADETFRGELIRALGEFQYYPDGGPFELSFDKRPINDLDLQGAYVFLLDRLFSDTSLYE